MGINRNPPLVQYGGTILGKMSAHFARNHTAAEPCAPYREDW